MNNITKAQKIIITIWILLIVVGFIITLAPVETIYLGQVTDTRLEPVFSQFFGIVLIISIPAFLIFRLWGKK
jgi:hypothetical protein